MRHNGSKSPQNHFPCAVMLQPVKTAQKLPVVIVMKVHHNASDAVTTGKPICHCKQSSKTGGYISALTV